MRRDFFGKLICFFISPFILSFFLKKSQNLVMTVTEGQAQIPILKILSAVVIKAPKDVAVSAHVNVKVAGMMGLVGQSRGDGGGQGITFIVRASGGGPDLDLKTTTGAVITINGKTVIGDRDVA